jgi:hypothetical protein
MSHHVTRFRPPPHWIPAVALYALAILWALSASSVPAAVDWDDYSEYVPPPGYELDIYRVLRRPSARDPKLDAAMARMHLLQRSMMTLANGTRWGDDRTTKYLLYTHHYERALAFAEEWRTLYRPLLTILSKDIIDDPDLPKEILKLREWGNHTALVLWEPIYPRHPYVMIKRVLAE